MRFGLRISRLGTGSMMIRRCRRCWVGFGPIIDGYRAIGSSELTLSFPFGPWSKSKSL